MPQGLQVWNAQAELVVDTSTFILKELVATPVYGASGSIPVVLPPSVSVVPSAKPAFNGQDEVAEATYLNNQVNYNFKSGNAGFATVRVYLY